MKILKKYFFSIFLLLAICLGGLTGYYRAPSALLQMIGTAYLKLMLIAVWPLIFFSLSSATIKIAAQHQIGRLFLRMLITFLILSFLAATYMLVIVTHFSINTNLPSLYQHTSTSNINWHDIFKINNILLLLIGSFCVGLLTHFFDERAKFIKKLLFKGNQLSQHIIQYLLYLAPLGFFAYFAVMVHELGPSLLMNYLRVGIIYYIAAIFYLCIMFSFFKKYCGHFFLPMLTALATCSSAASIPATFKACKAMDLSPAICESVLPFGTFIHKQGSILGGVLKISFLFAIFHIKFSGILMYSSAILVSTLVGTVMGAIPSGGMTGEMLIISLYGFPLETLITIAPISIIIDPLATVLNVIGNTVAVIIIEKFWEKPLCTQHV